MDRYWVPILSKKGNLIGYRHALAEKRVSSCPNLGRALLVSDRVLSHSCSPHLESTVEVPLQNDVEYPPTFYISEYGSERSATCSPKEIPAYSTCLLSCSRDFLADLRTCPVASRTRLSSFHSKILKAPLGDSSSVECYPFSTNSKYVDDVSECDLHSGYFLQDLQDSDSSRAYRTAQSRPCTCSTSYGICDVFSGSRTPDESCAIGSAMVFNVVASRVPGPIVSSNLICILEARIRIECSLCLSVEEWNFSHVVSNDYCEFRSNFENAISPLMALLCVRPCLTFHNFGRTDSLISPSLAVTFRKQLSVLTGNFAQKFHAVNETDNTFGCKLFRWKLLYPGAESFSFSKLFLQNSAAEDEQKSPNSFRKQALSALSPTPSHNTVDLECLVSVVHSDQSEIFTENKAIHPIEILVNPKSSLISVCGIDVDSEELRTLDEIPLEFAGAEIYLRRAVRADSCYGERGSFFRNHSFAKQKSFLDANPNKRSSILVRNLEDLTNAQPPNRNGQMKRIGSDVTSSPKIHRTSLSLIHPAQKPLFDRVPESLDEHDLASKPTLLSWATMDSTELSRGLKLMGIGSGNSSTDLYETFEVSKDPLHRTKDQAVQVNDSYLSQSFSTPLQCSFQSHSAYTITPSLHYCSLGHQHETSDEWRRASLDTSKLMVHIRQLAVGRVRSKGARFPINSQMFLSGFPLR